MRGWLRRTRGALGTAVTWSLAWIPFGALWGLGDWLLFPDSTPLSHLLVSSAALFGAVGFAGGLIFSTVLSRIEGRRRFSQMTVPRFLGWGALGGGLLSALLILGNGASPLSLADVIAFVTLPLLGAGSAAGSLVIARTVEETDLLAPPGDADEPELSDEDRVELLGSA